MKSIRHKCTYLYCRWRVWLHQAPGFIIRTAAFFISSNHFLHRLLGKRFQVTIQSQTNWLAQDGIIRIRVVFNLWFNSIPEECAKGAVVRFCGCPQGLKAWHMLIAISWVQGLKSDIIADSAQHVQVYSTARVQGWSLSKLTYGQEERVDLFMASWYIGKREALMRLEGKGPRCPMSRRKFHVVYTWFLMKWMDFRDNLMKLVEVVVEKLKSDLQSEKAEFSPL